MSLLLFNLYVQDLIECLIEKAYGVIWVTIFQYFYLCRLYNIIGT